MLKQFRTRYPHGSLISELIEIDRGQYIVKVTLQIQETILTTGLAAADKIETAEDRARERALVALALDSIPIVTDATEQVTKSIDEQINNSTTVVNLPIKSEITPPDNDVVTSDRRSESTIKPETNLVKPVTINPPVVSAVNTIAHNNPANSVMSTSTSVASLPEVEPTDLTISPADVPIATSSEDLRETTETKTLVTAVPAMAEISSETVNYPVSEVAATQPLEIVEFDFNEVKNQTEVEIKRLGWTKERGRDFLLATYGKRSRLHLTDAELMDFLRYLQSQ